MAEAPINLNRARKARARADAKKQADENAVKHGRSKAERDAFARQKVTELSRLDAHKRDDET